MKFANIIVEISAKSLDRPFTYLIPNHLEDVVEIGTLVTIPFGPSNREMAGYIIDFVDVIDFDPSKLKSIISVNTSVNVEGNLIRLAHWMQKRYLCTMQTALKSMVPSVEELNIKTKRIIHRLMSPEDIQRLNDGISNHERFKSRKAALNYLVTHDHISEKEFMDKTGATKAIIKSLVTQSVIVINDEETYRDPFSLESIQCNEKHVPNTMQKEAIDRIQEAINENRSDIFLLYGITGSGKTEVYLQVIDEVIKQGKKAIMLIPEIALTPQTVNRFVGRFGDTVGVLHSKLSKGEKYDQWRKAKEGKISIMIGPRSAIFAPFDNIGIIILDEEHETSYKSEMPPKYNAREVAIKRASMSGCPVVLGSATPLIESYYKALQGQYKLLKLNEKAVNEAAVDVQIVDMREELSNGNKTILSNALKEAMESALERKEQIILFLNRRGYSNFVSCRKCGYVLKCPNCDIPYTYHIQGEKMVCHYCNHSIKKVDKCPSCDSIYIKEFGIGTQKVEKIIKQTFPNARVLRMDMDTTSRKHAHESILEQVEQGSADILIGTQMVAKGHDFENVTVVGVIAADMSLYLSDFRACERTFQLVTQVTGRAGRGSKKGKAFIQTYTPDHYSLVCAKNQDYEGFYQNEIQFRQLMNYPPFSNIAILLLSSENEKNLIEEAFRIKDIICERIDEEIEILGPSPANISKIKNVYRWRVILKASQYKKLNKFIKDIQQRLEKDMREGSVHVQMDINPMMSY